MTKARNGRTRRFFHVTDRRYTEDILSNGFLAGTGSAGPGTYLFRERWLADDWIDGHPLTYTDPVILVVRTPDEVVPASSLADPAQIDHDMIRGHFIHPHRPGTRWKPAAVSVHEDFID
jgi:hypothetical protein